MKKGIALIAVMVIIGVAIFSYVKSRHGVEDVKRIEGVQDNGAYPVTYREYKNNPDWKGGERNPIISPVYFDGVIREAYESAAAIPDVLDHLYCYCYCAQDHGHKSLRTCFTDGHGSGCDICVNEAVLAKRLHDKGYSIKEIREQIDKEFYEPYQSHNHM